METLVGQTARRRGCAWFELDLGQRVRGRRVEILARDGRVFEGVAGKSVWRGRTDIDQPVRALIEVDNWSLIRERVT